MLFRAVLPGMQAIDEAYEQTILIAVLESLGAPINTQATP